MYAPEFPLVDCPVENKIMPETPEMPAFCVKVSMLPLEVAVEKPDKTVIEPPEWESVVFPDVTTIDPPVPEFPVPTSTWINPALPLCATPVSILT